MVNAPSIWNKSFLLNLTTLLSLSLQDTDNHMYVFCESNLFWDVTKWGRHTCFQLQHCESKWDLSFIDPRQLSLWNLFYSILNIVIQFIHERGLVASKSNNIQIENNKLALSINHSCQGLTSCIFFLIIKIIEWEITVIIVNTTESICNKKKNIILDCLVKRISKGTSF